MYQKINIVIAFLAGIVIPILVVTIPIAWNNLSSKNHLVFEVEQYVEINKSDIIKLNVKNNSDKAEKNVKIVISRNNFAASGKIKTHYDSSRAVDLDQTEDSAILSIGDLKSKEVFSAVIYIDGGDIWDFYSDGYKGINVTSDERIASQKYKNVFYEMMKPIAFWLCATIIFFTIFLSIVFEYALPYETKIRWLRRQIKDYQKQIDSITAKINLDTQPTPPN